MANGFRWTDVASDGHSIVNNCEQDNFLAECSGYVTYEIGFLICIDWP